MNKFDNTHMSSLFKDTSLSNYVLSTSKDNVMCSSVKSSSLGDRNETLLLETTDFVIDPNSAVQLASNHDSISKIEQNSNKQKIEESRIFQDLQITLNQFKISDKVRQDLAKPEVKKQTHNKRGEIDKLHTICSILLDANRELARKIDEIQLNNEASQRIELKLDSTKKYKNSTVQLIKIEDSKFSVNNSIENVFQKNSMTNRPFLNFQTQNGGKTVQSSIDTKLTQRFLQKSDDGLKHLLHIQNSSEDRTQESLDLPSYTVSGRESDDRLNYPFAKSKCFTKEIEYILNEYRNQISNLMEQAQSLKEENKESKRIVKVYKNDLKLLKKQFLNLQESAQKLKQSNLNLKEKLIKQVKQQQTFYPNSNSFAEPTHMQGYNSGSKLKRRVFQNFEEIAENEKHLAHFGKVDLVNGCSQETQPQNRYYIESEARSPYITKKKSTTFDNLDSLTQIGNEVYRKSPRTPCHTPNYIKFHRNSRNACNSSILSNKKMKKVKQPSLQKQLIAINGYERKGNQTIKTKVADISGISGINVKACHHPIHWQVQSEIQQFSEEGMKQFQEVEEDLKFQRYFVKEENLKSLIKEIVIKQENESEVSETKTEKMTKRQVSNRNRQIQEDLDENNFNMINCLENHTLSDSPSRDKDESVQGAGRNFKSFCQARMVQQIQEKEKLPLKHLLTGSKEKSNSNQAKNQNESSKKSNQRNFYSPNTHNASAYQTSHQKIESFR